MPQTDEILQRLLKLHPRIIDLGLERIMRLLGQLGDPHLKLPPVIHVAGTNGKGSAIAHLRAMLEAGGNRVHVYTSPHLVRFNERIRLAGALVSSAQLDDALERCEKINGGAPITYFEITTAAAFLLFSEIEADYLLLEVGLGGRHDATNVVDAPLGTIIMPVSIDHVEFFGDALDQIALEKAGILKKDTPVVVARQGDDALDVIEGCAADLGITPFLAGRDFDSYAQNGRLVYQDEAGLLDLPAPALLGTFQFDNAGVAVAAARHFGLGLDDAAISRGIETAIWPARMMPLRTGALRDLLGGNHELWLDGGHNEAGGEVLAQSLAEMDRRAPKELVLIVGAYANKDARGFLTHFRDLPEQVLTLEIPGDRAAWAADDLARVARQLGLAAEAASSIEEALRIAARRNDARVAICGGLFLAGHVLALNGNVLD